MIGWLASALLKAGIPSRYVRFASIAIVVSLVVLVAVIGSKMIVSFIAERAVTKHETSVQLEVETGGRKADQKAVDRQAERRAKAAQKRKEFDDATAHLAPEGLTDRQRLDICNELLAAGTNAHLIPQCRDALTRAQAGAGRGHSDSQ